MKKLIFDYEDIYKGLELDPLKYLICREIHDIVRKSFFNLSKKKRNYILEILFKGKNAKVNKKKIQDIFEEIHENFIFFYYKNNATTDNDIINSVNYLTESESDISVSEISKYII